MKIGFLKRFWNKFVMLFGLVSVVVLTIFLSTHYAQSQPPIKKVKLAQSKPSPTPKSFPLPSPPQTLFEKMVIEDNREHLRWIQGCSPSPISTYGLDDDLIIYATDLGPESALIQCLFPNVAKDSSDQKAFIFASPIGVKHSGEGHASPRPDAFLQTDRKAIIVTSAGSSRGVMQIRHVSGDTFIVQTGYLTHRRVYLVFGNRDEVKYLTDGDVYVVDAEQLIFRVKWRKAYFKPVGAFWFDALIDRNGKILDIVTPMTNGDGLRVECMSRDQLIQKSRLDLSQVSDHRVCVRKK